MDKEQIVHLQGMGINRENRGKYQTRGESEKRNKQGKSKSPWEGNKHKPCLYLGRYRQGEDFIELIKRRGWIETFLPDL